MDYSNNYINAEISIKKGQNKKQRLINSYENWKREHLTDWDWDNIISENNEEEIKLCELYIQTKKINFTYLYNFEKYGKYQVKFIFKVPIKSINFLFTDCYCITSLDFSNFKIKKSLSMTHCFYGCKCLRFLKMNKLNTSEILDMGYLFGKCHSLKFLDLSNLDTINVVNMRGLFEECKILESIDLKKFETKNVKYMDYMFSENNKLKELNLSNFNTKNVINF